MQFRGLPTRACPKCATAHRDTQPSKKKPHKDLLHVLQQSSGQLPTCRRQQYSKMRCGPCGP
jgi:hypothetical protein